MALLIALLLIILIVVISLVTVTNIVVISLSRVAFRAIPDKCPEAVHRTIAIGLLTLLKIYIQIERLRFQKRRLKQTTEWMDR